MLDAIKKKLGMVEAQPVAEVVEQVVEASTEQVVDMAVFAEMSETLASQVTKLATLVKSLADANEALAQLKADKEAVELTVKQTKMAARRAIVEAAIGTEKADAFLAATEMLEDAQFNSVSSALAGSVKAEAETAMFKDVGHDAQAEKPSNPQETQEAKLLKAKFAPAKQKIKGN